jgi:hypothetical protein
VTPAPSTQITSAVTNSSLRSFAAGRLSMEFMINVCFLGFVGLGFSTVLGPRFVGQDYEQSIDFRRLFPVVGSVSR